MKRLMFFLMMLTLSAAITSAEISTELEDEIEQAEPQEMIEIIIQTGPESPNDRQEILSEHGEVNEEFDTFETVHLEIPSQAVENIADLDWVESVEPNYQVTTMLEDSVRQINTQDVWEYNVSGEGVDVAVLDTGIHTDHESIEVGEEVDFTGEGTEDLNGHGTHVAGIVASQDENLRGISYEANIGDLKVLNEEGEGSATQILDGLEHTVQNDYDIAVLSLGAELEECDGDDTLSRAVDQTVEEGVFVSVAAGNNGPETETITAPGCSREGTTVGSVDKNDEIAQYSGRGPTADGRTKPDVVAPGSNIESLHNEGGSAAISGTSMATPHVAGQAALMLEEDPELTPNELEETISQTAENLDLDENTQGAGRIDANASFHEVTEVNLTEPEEEETLEENQTEETNETDDEIGEDEKENETGIPSHAEADEQARRMMFGPDSRFYGIRTGLDRAAMTVGLRSREEVMERRAREALTMAEKGENEAAERALGSMRNTAGDRENATQEAQETLERVMEDAPEEAQEGLRNALENVERRRQGPPEDAGQGDQSPEEPTPGSPQQQQGPETPEGEQEDGPQDQPDTPAGTGEESNPDQGQQGQADQDQSMSPQDEGQQEPEHPDQTTTEEPSQVPRDTEIPDSEMRGSNMEDTNQTQDSQDSQNDEDQPGNQSESETPEPGTAQEFPN